MPSAGKANVTKGPSASTRSARKHQDFLNKPLTGRALNRAAWKEQAKFDKKAAADEFSRLVKKKELELKKKSKQYFIGQ